MKIIKFIKSIFEQDYILNHYEQFVIDSILNVAPIEFKDILINQLTYVKFTIKSFDYHRYVRRGFTNFYFKNKSDDILFFDTIRKSNLLAKCVIIDKGGYKHEAFLYIDEFGLISDIKYFSSRIAMKKKFMPLKPYYLEAIEFYEY